MNNKKARCKKIDSRFYVVALPLSLRENKATEAISKSKFFSKPSRKISLLFIILILFLISSFLASASSQSINMTNIWYKKLPNYTHITIKASGAISEYKVSYLEAPERIVIDVKNAFYKIDELVKNILFLNMGSVKQVRCGQFESEPIPITRFVVDLFQKSDYEVKLSPDRRLLYVDVYDYTEFKAPEEQVFTVTPVKSEAVKIEKEEVKKSIVDTVTKTINLNLKEAEVVDAIRALSEISGIDIVVDDSVEGKITLNLKDKSFKDSLDLITKLKGLDYTEVTGTLIIAKKDVIESYKKPITKIFELKNASADEAKGILDNYIKEGLKGSINIVADSRLNTLIVTGGEEEIEIVKNLITTIDEELSTETFKIDNAIDEEDIKAIQNMLSIIIPDAENRIKIDDRQREIIVKGTKEEIKKVEGLIPKLDKRATQMAIEIKFVEISLNDSKELGIKWTSGGEEGQIGIGELTLGGPLERYDKIEAQIKALQTKNKLNMISNPIVYTSNGKKAFIHSGSRVPYEEETPEGGKKINWEDVGISMTITPWIRSDGLITMFIRADKSYLGAVKVRDLPVIETQEIGYKEEQKPALIISAYPEETKVIGGLIESKEGEIIVKIPILGDIPVIGKLFQRTNKMQEKTELIILITPHILDY
ncbi:MAG: secretin N-terminal domain-containing protein [Atribacterota bacterium]